MIKHLGKADLKAQFLAKFCHTCDYCDFRATVLI